MASSVTISGSILLVLMFHPTTPAVISFIPFHCHSISFVARPSRREVFARRSLGRKRGTVLRHHQVIAVTTVRVLHMESIETALLAHGAGRTCARQVRHA